MTTLARGDRVRLSPQGRQALNVRNPDRLGTLASIDLQNSACRVLWDGNKVPVTYCTDYLEKVTTR